MSISTESNNSGIKGVSSSGRAQDDIVPRSSGGNIDRPFQPEPLTSGATTTTLEVGRALLVNPRRTRYMDPFSGMEEDQMEGNESHELMDLSLRALRKRIRTLEQTITALTSARKQPQTIITPWRVLNSAFVLGLGAYKAEATYRGQTIGPTTADWIIGVVWTLIAYWVSFFDDPTPGHSNWFFSYDLSGVMFVVFVGLGAFGLCIGVGRIELAILEAIGATNTPVYAFGLAIANLPLFFGLASGLTKPWKDGLFDMPDWSIMNSTGLVLMPGFALIYAYSSVAVAASSHTESPMRPLKAHGSTYEEKMAHLPAPAGDSSSPGIDAASNRSMVQDDTLVPAAAARDAAAVSSEESSFDSGVDVGDARVVNDEGPGPAT
ncbi:hypothetical protein B0H11DRAFT_2298514 [Mycena galericulata]|nr:hypothetical protein B0H11DRAFT_2298514 [Mycena galericulata]